jgi:hypothetical protein
LHQSKEIAMFPTKEIVKSISAATYNAVGAIANDLRYTGRVLGDLIDVRVDQELIFFVDRTKRRASNRRLEPFPRDTQWIDEPPWLLFAAKKCNISRE